MRDDTKVSLNVVEFIRDSNACHSLLIGCDSVFDNLYEDVVRNGKIIKLGKSYLPSVNAHISYLKLKDYHNELRANHNKLKNNYKKGLLSYKRFKLVDDEFKSFDKDFKIFEGIFELQYDMDGIPKKSVIKLWDSFLNKVDEIKSYLTAVLEANLNNDKKVLKVTRAITRLSTCDCKVCMQHGASNKTVLSYDTLNSIITKQV